MIQIVRCLEENIFHAVSPLKGQGMTIAKFISTSAGIIFQITPGVRLGKRTTMEWNEGHGSVG